MFIMNENYLITLPNRVVEFLHYQSNVKNKSELTLNEYCLDLRLFFRFLVLSSEKTKFSDEDIENTNITFISDDFYKKITLNDAYRFLSYCKTERKNQEKSRARKASAIRTFFKYLKMN